jgi:hypothetical protein
MGWIKLVFGRATNPPGLKSPCKPNDPDRPTYSDNPDGHAAPIGDSQLPVDADRKPGQQTSHHDIEQTPRRKHGDSFGISSDKHHLLS